MKPKDLFKHGHDFTINAKFQHLSFEEQYKNRNLSKGEEVIGINYSEDLDATHQNIIRSHCAYLIDLIEQSKMNVASMDKGYIEELADESKILIADYNKAIALITQACDFIDVDFSENMWKVISGVPYGVPTIKLPGCDAIRAAESARRKNKK